MSRVEGASPVVHTAQRCREQLLRRCWILSSNDSVWPRHIQGYFSGKRRKNIPFVTTVTWGQIRSCSNPLVSQELFFWMFDFEISEKNLHYRRKALNFLRVFTASLCLGISLSRTHLGLWCPKYLLTVEQFKASGVEPDCLVLNPDSPTFMRFFLGQWT